MEAGGEPVLEGEEDEGVEGVEHHAENVDGEHLFIACESEEGEAACDDEADAQGDEFDEFWGAFLSGGKGDAVYDLGNAETDEEAHAAVECDDKRVDGGEGGDPVEPGGGSFDGGFEVLEFELIGSYDVAHGLGIRVG